MPPNQLLRWMCFWTRECTRALRCMWPMKLSPALCPFRLWKHLWRPGCLLCPAQIFLILGDGWVLCFRWDWTPEEPTFHLSNCPCASAISDIPLRTARIDTRLTLSLVSWYHAIKFINKNQLFRFVVSFTQFDQCHIHIHRGKDNPLCWLLIDLKNPGAIPPLEVASYCCSNPSENCLSSVFILLKVKVARALFSSFVLKVKKKNQLYLL